ncbi:hypothetical protein IFM89_026115 [Coptis chinensis]|uniref:Reverse transcriptase zinc-binding domain-containing protein n=1 Tax=Coptis chinensis TaxID=261450 RepID=A0A835M1P1_9MAGN|nr:hypothetical protein IFM89_026115 [Coptis chinensis]
MNNEVIVRENTESEALNFAVVAEIVVAEFTEGGLEAVNYADGTKVLNCVDGTWGFVYSLEGPRIWMLVGVLEDGGHLVVRFLDNPSGTTDNDQVPISNNYSVLADEDLMQLTSKDLKGCTAKVNQLIVNNELSIPQQLQQILNQVRVDLSLVMRDKSGDQDYQVWCHDSKGRFSTKSTFDAIRNRRQHVNWATSIWRPYLHPRISAIAWKLSQKSAATDDRVQQVRCPSFAGVAPYLVCYVILPHARTGLLSMVTMPLLYWRAAVIRAECESEAGKVISDATKEFGNGLIQLRILEAVRENVATLANSNNVIYLPKGMNAFLGLNPGQARW